MRLQAHAGLRRAATGRAPPTPLPGGTRPAAAAALAPLRRLPRARARALRRTSRSAPARRTRACMRVSACVGAPAAARPPRPRFGGAAAAAHGGAARSPAARTHLPAPRPPLWQLRALHSPLGPHHTGLASLRRLRAAGAAPAATRARAHSAPCSRSHPVPSEHSLYTGQHRTGSAVWGERAWGHRTAPLRASVRVRVPPGA